MTTASTTAHDSFLDDDVTTPGTDPAGPPADRRRIALCTDAWHPQVNGVVRTLSTVVEDLEARGHEVLVVHPGLFRTMPCPRYPEIRLAPFCGAGVRRRLREFAPDAIHVATEGPIGLAARRWCRRRRIPFTTSYHTQFALYLKKYAAIPPAWTYRAMRWFHGAAERTLVPTPSTGRELESFGFTNIVVWTRGVDVELFRPMDRDFLGLERPVFAYCGRVAVEKNIEAFLALDLPGTKLVIGDGPMRSTLERRFPDACFVGMKRGEELVRHFSEGDVFVFPSRTDTFGVVMLEANACGLPIAAYPVTGPIDVVEPGVNGFVDEDLASAARRALAIDRGQCRRHALGYTWSRCATMFRDNLAPIGASMRGGRAGG